jgi:hypothetical protein
VVPKLPQQVITMMARRPMRQHHYLWHTARSNWLRFPDDVKAVFRRLGWEPPRPAVDANGNPIETNDSAEDFLFMHRQMIEQVNRTLAEVGDPDYPGSRTGRRSRPRATPTTRCRRRLTPATPTSTPRSNV